MDWIERYLAYTAGHNAPEIFRLWAGITVISGALERRCWTYTSLSDVYPNLFTLLVATPGIGKTQAINPAEGLWYKANRFKIAPNSVTRASLIDALDEAKQILVTPGQIHEYHSLLVANSELGVIIPKHDLDFLSTINYLYDNPTVPYRETRRTNKLNIEIPNPQMVILAGAQPGFLQSLLPEEAWSMGFTSRMIMVYSDSGPEVELFGDRIDDKAGATILADALSSIADLSGQFKWEKSAQVELQRWASAGCRPVPVHPRLQHYITRRTLHVIKLAMISAVSQSRNLIVRMSDLTRAREWLFEAELKMPDIFKAMIAKSDHQLVADMHKFVLGLFNARKEPVPESEIYLWLSDKTPSERVPKIIEMAEKMAIIVRPAGPDRNYTPKAMRRA